MYTIKGQDQKDYGPVNAEQVRLWLAQGRIDARTLVRAEGTTEWRPLGSFPELASAVGLPPLPPAFAPASPPPSDNPLATIVPYRNVPALIAYYLGVFSLIPCIGFVLGIGGIVLGIFGLKEAGKHPESKGKVHAWIGIVVGGLVVLAHVVFFIVCLVAASKRQ
jgi:hypothetical protein